MATTRQRFKNVEDSHGNISIDRHGACLLCGMPFQVCSHSYGEVERAIEVYQNIKIYDKYFKNG